MTRVLEPGLHPLPTVTKGILTGTFWHVSLLKYGVGCLAVAAVGYCRSAGCANLQVWLRMQAVTEGTSANGA